MAQNVKAISDNKKFFNWKVFKFTLKSALKSKLFIILVAFTLIIQAIFLRTSTLTLVPADYDPTPPTKEEIDQFTLILQQLPEFSGMSYEEVWEIAKRLLTPAPIETFTVTLLNQWSGLYLLFLMAPAIIVPLFTLDMRQSTTLKRMKTFGIGKAEYYWSVFLASTVLTILFVGGTYAILAIVLMRGKHSISGNSAHDLIIRMYEYVEIQWSFWIVNILMYIHLMVVGLWIANRMKKGGTFTFTMVLLILFVAFFGGAFMAPPWWYVWNTASNPRTFVLVMFILGMITPLGAGFAALGNNFIGHSQLWIEIVAIVYLAVTTIILTWHTIKTYNFQQAR